MKQLLIVLAALALILCETFPGNASAEDLPASTLSPSIPPKAPMGPMAPTGCSQSGAICIPDGNYTLTYIETGTGICNWTLTINWGDGSSETHTFSTGTNGLTASHHYANPGVYTGNASGSGTPVTPNTTCTVVPYSWKVEVPVTKSSLSPEAKAAFRKNAEAYGAIALSCTVTSAICAVIPHALAKVCSAGTARIAPIFTVAATWAAKEALDPADPNFTEIANPVIPSLPPLAFQADGTQQVADAFNTLIRNDEQIIGVSGALVTSLEREQGAFLAGDTYWTEQQHQAFIDYATQLALLMTKEPDLLKNLQKAWQAAGLPSVPVTTDDVLSFQQNVALQGLPADFTEVLVLLGVDTATIEQIKNEIAVLNASAAAGSFPEVLTKPELISSLLDTAHSLSEIAGFIAVDVDIQPGQFLNSINPGKIGVIPVAILTTATFDATTVDPLSVKFGPSGATEMHGQRHIEDVNDDGKPDLVLHFSTQSTGIKCGDESASLTGKDINENKIRGFDYIKTAGCH